MKAFGILLLVLVLSLISTAQSATFPETATRCPILTEGETAADCPWAEIVRDLETVIRTNENPETTNLKVSARLDVIAPELMRRMEIEGKLAGATKLLWGRSINFDEGVKKIIVPEPILDNVLARVGVAKRGEGVDSPIADRIVHAGFEHTYAYLLSNLKTPYGYKRLRWVRPDIENGFGLPAGSISPLPPQGGLFANVTHFAGRIAFREMNEQDLAATRVLKRGFQAARSIRSFEYASLRGRRITETVEITDGANPARVIEIRTDFVPFTKASGEATGGNAELLIYSIRDSALKLPYLVTAFPIAKGFSDNAADPKNLGDDKTIFTRYNAFVPGLTDAKLPLAGKRTLSSF